MKRHLISITIVILLAVSAIIAYSSTDPQRGEIEKLFYEFRGDLQTSNYESAAERIFPPDLMKWILSE